jgi:hypothetical protein
MHINTWPFPHRSEYHPETPISTQDRYNTNKLLYEETIEIIKSFSMEVCVFNKYISRILLSNKIISTPININGDIWYEGILKHRKLCRFDSFVSLFIYRESYWGPCLWIVFIQNPFLLSMIIIYQLKSLKCFFSMWSS